jgi:hypothetical protein
LSEDEKEGSEMNTQIIKADSEESLSAMIAGLGAKNVEMMARRGVYANILVKDVPGAHARLLKRHYNDVGGEVAISHDAWLEKKDAVTDILVMGSIHQHGEVRAALGSSPELQPILDAIKAALV